jgi:hypothetical protein
MGTKQSVISRLENPDYGRVTLSSILDVAAALDVAFVGRYCSFAELIHRQQDVSPAAFYVSSFDANELCARREVSLIDKPASRSTASDVRFFHVGSAALAGSSNAALAGSK